MGGQIEGASWRCAPEITQVAVMMKPLEPPGSGSRWPSVLVIDDSSCAAATDRVVTRNPNWLIDKLCSKG
jgi:hypothetical protein